MIKTFEATEKIIALAHLNRVANKNYTPSQQCPIAVAVNATLRAGFKANVAQTSITIYTSPGGYEVSRAVRVPPQQATLINAFDAGKAVKPLRFQAEFAVTSPFKD